MGFARIFSQEKKPSMGDLTKALEMDPDYAIARERLKDVELILAREH
jgi:hypothetical protein